MKNLSIILGLFLLPLSLLNAQSNWSVNPADYQFSMTVTGEALIDCQSNIEPTDEVAAFVGGTCRGFIDFGTLVNGENIAYLIVYSNQSIGETLSFQIWDSSANTFIDLNNELTFEENGSFGTGTNPYLFTNNYPPTALDLNNINIADFNMMGDTIANFSVSDLDNNTYTFSFQNSATNDNDFFTIIDDQLVLAADVDYANQPSYTIEVLAEDNLGCSISQNFTIDVFNTNQGPYDIFFVDDDNFMNENESIGSLLGQLGVLDSTLVDSHVFSLDTPSIEFSIVGDEVLSELVFNYEEQSSYSIRVRVTDAVGNFYVETMEVEIKDVVELNDLKANNVITPNGDGFNDFFTIPNIELFADFEFVVYNENGNQLFRRTASAGYNNMWNGTTNEGQDLPSGAYYYSLYNPTTSERFVGVINLLRN